MNEETTTPPTVDEKIEGLIRKIDWLERRCEYANSTAESTIWKFNVANRVYEILWSFAAIIVFVVFVMGIRGQWEENKRDYATQRAISVACVRAGGEAFSVHGMQGWKAGCSRTSVEPVRPDSVIVK